jgi:hypothetical protein
MYRDLDMPGLLERAQTTMTETGSR